MAAWSARACWTNSPPRRAPAWAPRTLPPCARRWTATASPTSSAPSSSWQCPWPRWTSAVWPCASRSCRRRRGPPTPAASRTCSSPAPASPRRLPAPTTPGPSRPPSPEEPPRRPDLHLRAYFDTRATAIVMTVPLLALLAFAALGGLLVPLVLPEEVVDVETTVIALSLPLSLIIPAIAVLITAGEWSDRSIQFTLLQRPSRNAVLLSKTLAASVVTAGVVALAIALAAATTWIGGELLGQGADFSSMEGVMTTQLAT